MIAGGTTTQGIRQFVEANAALAIWPLLRHVTLMFDIAPSTRDRTMNALLRNTSLFAIAAVFAVNVAGAQDSDAGSFTGSLRGTQGARGTAMGRVGDSSRLSGTVLIEPSSTAKSGQYKVAIRLQSTGGMAPTSILQWTVAPGRCGARLQPLVPPTAVSPLEVRSGGDAETSWEGPLALTPDGGFQLVVFGMSGVREQDVMACANLKYNKSKR